MRGLWALIVVCFIMLEGYLELQRRLGDHSFNCVPIVSLGGGDQRMKPSKRVSEPTPVILLKGISKANFCKNIKTPTVYGSLQGFNQFIFCEIGFSRYVSGDCNFGHQHSFASIDHMQLAGEREIFREGIGQDQYDATLNCSISGGSPCINLSEAKANFPVWSEIPHRLRRDIEIGPQLSLGSFIGADDQIASRQPESKRSERQQRGENSYQRIGDFESEPIKRRPELGSLFVAILCLGLAFPAAAFASDAWRSGRRAIGSFMFCVVAFMGLQSTIGVLLGIDVWSIWRMLQ